MLNRYVELLKKGDIVAFPTETVYGLGADARNPSAIRKVFEQKKRPADNPLIVHIASIRMAESFANTISEDAKKLMQHFWPGPLTLIFPKKPKVLDIITAGLDTVALRWPSHPLSQELIAQAGPLVAPSANTSGKPSPTKAEHVKEDFGEDFPVIDAGETDIGLESTVLDISSEPFQIFRPGAISAAQIEQVISKKISTAEPSTETEKSRSPGIKYTHYAPRARVRWLEGAPQKNKDTLYLLHSLDFNTQVQNIVHYEGNYRRMAHELFDRFRQADHQGIEQIVVEPFSERKKNKSGIANALYNRIYKAVD